MKETKTKEQQAQEYAEKKICTTQDQSARLLKCGVSADTADMCWHAAIVPRGGSLTSMPEPSEEWDLWAEPYDCMPEELQAAKLMDDYNEIQPAWSLSALLGLLPFKIHSGKYEYWLDIAPMDYSKQWSIGYYCMEKPKVIKGLTRAYNLIECAVQEFEWLTANGYKLKRRLRCLTADSVCATPSRATVPKMLTPENTARLLE